MATVRRRAGGGAVDVWAYGLMRTRRLAFDVGGWLPTLARASVHVSEWIIRNDLQMYTWWKWEAPPNRAAICDSAMCPIDWHLVLTSPMCG